MFLAERRLIMFKTEVFWYQNTQWNHYLSYFVFILVINNAILALNPHAMCNLGDNIVNTKWELQQAAFGHAVPVMLAIVLRVPQINHVHWSYIVIRRCFSIVFDFTHILNNSEFTLTTSLWPRHCVVSKLTSRKGFNKLKILQKPYHPSGLPGSVLLTVIS